MPVVYASCVRVNLYRLHVMNICVTLRAVRFRSLIANRFCDVIMRILEVGALALGQQ